MQSLYIHLGYILTFFLFSMFKIASEIIGFFINVLLCCAGGIH